MHYSVKKKGNLFIVFLTLTLQSVAKAIHFNLKSIFMAYIMVTYNGIIKTSYAKIFVSKEKKMPF